MKSTLSNNPSAWTRRDFVRRSSTAALCAALPSPFITQNFGSRNSVDAYLAHAHLRPEHPASLMDPSVVRALALRAIDAAKAAGATYAEARVTRIVSQGYLGGGLLSDNEDLGLGVRAFVNGAWGFAASPYLVLEEADQLGKDAVAQATINARVLPRQVDLGTYPVASGSWNTPIRIDPFTIPMEEKIDYALSLQGLAPRHVRGRTYSAVLTQMGFVRQERAVATTEGAFFTQTFYETSGEFRLQVVGKNPATSKEDRVTLYAEGLDPAGGGWERILDAKLPDQLFKLIDEAEQLLFLPQKPVEIGRYDVVCDAITMASLVAGTFGQATELDRAMGYEANAGGTSYLGPDPLEHLGTTLGTSSLNVTADRSMPSGLATAKWDDEGVEPESFPLVTNGALVDYQTTREQASWLTPWYQKQNRAIRSHGCARSSSALDIPMQRTPNLTIAPGKEDIGFAEMVANTKRGLAIVTGGVSMDFQSRSGSGGGRIREITNGKLGPNIVGAGFLFDSSQLWKTLKVLGGASGQKIHPASGVKGEPARRLSYSVSAVPGIFKDMAIIDIRRKA